MVARNNENLGGVLQSNAAQWRAYLSNLMQQRGIDPGRNIYAAQALNRAPEAQWLAQAMNVGDTGIQDFGDQWVNARFNGGGNYGGVDLSRGGMTNWLQNALATTDRSSPQFKMFNTGDPDADYANLRSAMGIVQGGYSPMAQQAEQRALGDWYNRALGQMQQAGPGTPTNLLNYYYGRQDPGAPLPSGAAPLGSVPPGSAAGTGTPGSAAQTNAATNPTAAQTQANALASGNALWNSTLAANGGQTVNATAASGPGSPGYRPASAGVAPANLPGTPGYDPNKPISQGGITPNYTTPIAGQNNYANTGTGQQSPTTAPTVAYTMQPRPASTPGWTQEAGGGTRPGLPPRSATQQTGAITSWAQLLDKYRADQRNWGTEGYRPNPGAFNIGGIAYDPSKDAVTDWNNMSGSGRTTHRGNMMGQFLYYLNLLRTQRDGAGNKALGITRATTDDQLAQIAKDRMSKNAVGSTGFA